jgi:hypothetical protein
MIEIELIKFIILFFKIYLRDVDLGRDNGILIAINQIGPIQVITIDYSIYSTQLSHLCSRIYSLGILNEQAKTISSYINDKLLSDNIIDGKEKIKLKC